MAEDVKPDAIYHHACGQRIRGTGDQVGDLTPSAAEYLEAILTSRNELEKPALDCPAGMCGVTGRQHREIVAGIEVRHPLEDLRRGDTGLGEVIVVEQRLQSG